ncbi:MAG TPA: FkbM family methyltransferase, partial [Bacteroidia bacterium]|nr:FkbM family methyltransferase [Bacteroidia bacterium]
MILKLLHLPTKFIRFFIIARGSDYANFSDKWEVYKTLLSLYIKTAIFSKQTKNVSQRIFGYKVYGYDYATLFSLYREIFVKQLYKVDLKKQGPKIIDCGANIGMAVLYFKKNYPQSSVLAFEPNPYVFEILERNIRENKLENTKAFNVALSDTNGSIDFYLGSELGSQQGSLFSSRGGDNKLAVEARKLSDYINHEKFDLIKIDVEGAEVQILRDISQFPEFSSPQ